MLANKDTKKCQRKSERMFLHYGTVLSAQMKCLFQRCQNLLNAPKPTSSSKNMSIKTISKKVTEIIKCFFQVNQIFDDNENVATIVLKSSKNSTYSSENFPYCTSIYLHFLRTLMI